MWHIYTMEYYAAIKKDEFMLQGHHSEQADTRTENQALHVLTHKWELKTGGHRKGNNTNQGLSGNGW